MLYRTLPGPGPSLVRRLAGLWAAGLLCAAAPGCGDENALPAGPRVQASGKVVLADGKPLAGGKVIFIPTGEQRVQATGELNAEGHYTLGMQAPGDGALAGPYKVRIEPPPALKPGKSRKVVSFPSRYLDEDASGLKVELRPETTAIPPIQLR